MKNTLNDVENKISEDRLNSIENDLSTLTKAFEEKNCSYSKLKKIHNDKLIELDNYKNDINKSKNEFEN
jgi:predicted secreted protein